MPRSQITELHLNRAYDKTRPRIEISIRAIESQLEVAVDYLF